STMTRRSSHFRSWCDHWPLVQQGDRMSADDLVLFTVERGLARIALNRPSASNAMNVEFLEALCRAVMACHGEPGIRAVLLRGGDRTFGAGGGIHGLAGRAEHMTDYIRGATAWLQNAGTGLMGLEAPVIASVQGFASGGGGFGLVCAADLVIAADSA